MIYIHSREFIVRDEKMPAGAPPSHFLGLGALLGLGTPAALPVSKHGLHVGLPLNLGESPFLRGVFARFIKPPIPSGKYPEHPHFFAVTLPIRIPYFYHPAALYPLFITTTTPTLELPAHHHTDLQYHTELHHHTLTIIHSFPTLRPLRQAREESLAQKVLPSEPIPVIGYEYKWAD